MIRKLFSFARHRWYSRHPDNTCFVPIPPPPFSRFSSHGEQQHVGIPSKRKGEKVNLEVDVLGKYVERSLSSVLDRLGALEEFKQVRTAGKWEFIYMCTLCNI